MRIFIGADHNGYELKEHVEKYLISKGHEVIDKGDEQLDPQDDFPIYAGRVASEVLANAGSVGILICGSGQGVCIGANRFKGIRASLIWNEDEAHDSRHDDDSNVMCLPARELQDNSEVERLVDTWLDTEFGGAARYIRRNKQLDNLN